MFNGYVGQPPPTPPFLRPFGSKRAELERSPLPSPFSPLPSHLSPLTSHDEYAQFVEQPDGEADDEEGEDVRRGRDDGGDDEDGHDGVAAIAAHHGAADEAHAAEDGTDDGQLEDDADDEAHRDERVDIAAERQHVVDVGAHLIRAQEAHRQGEDDEVVDERAQGEHRVGGADDPERCTPLARIEAWRDEAEQLVEDVGQGAEQSRIEGHAHVGHELLRQTRVHQVEAEGLDVQ